MCGFVALIGRDGRCVDPLVVDRMTDTLHHRGPDGRGVFIAESVGLGFRRLSILDLSPTGDQPMHSADGRYVMVFNGEIFNYIELRRQLTAKGHEFRSSGDSEVLLHAYMEWGEGCLDRLNGMWAMAIFDKQSGEVFVARDRFGIKPLYCYVDEDWVILASEIKAILASGLANSETNWPVVAKFFVDGRLDDNRDTFFADIHQFDNGSSMIVRPGGKFERRRFWSIPEDGVTLDGDPASDYAELFEHSVELRLRSDVPVGVLLSGGLDSTSIICSVARLKESGAAADATETLAFSFNTREFDESEYIKATIAQTGARLVDLDTDSKRLWESLGALLQAHDEPVHSATALVGFKLLELAAQSGLKVVLTGQGADEAVAGYPSYFANFWHSLLRRGSAVRAWRQISAHADRFGGSVRQQFLAEFAKLIKTGMSHVPMYRQVARYRRRRDHFQHAWFRNALLDDVPQADDRPWDLRLDTALRESVETAPLPLYLRIEDRNSMAHSVEARLPFMDYRLISLSFALRDELKMQGPWNKFILREAMRGRIPEVVRTRLDKFGFPTPVDEWFRGPLLEPMRDILNSRSIREAGIFDVDEIERDLERHVNGEVAVGNDLFAVAQFAEWQRQQSCD